MNIKHTLLLSALVGMVLSAAATAANLGAESSPYLTADEINATMSMRTTAEERLADSNNPYILSDEVAASMGCSDPSSKLVADSSNPYVTFGQLKTAEMNRKC